MAYDIVAQQSTGVTSPAEVAIWKKGTDNATLYTVPTGKMFRGWIIARDASSGENYKYTPSGGTALDGSFFHTSTGFEGRWPINMNAGDQIACRSSHYWTLMGIETAINTVSWDTSS